MRTSRIVLLSGVAAVVVALVAVALVVRLSLPSPGSAAQPAGAGPSDDGTRVTQAFALRDFDRIGVIGSWAVTVTQGSEWQVSATYPSGRERNVEVGVEGDRLTAHYRAPSFRFFRRQRGEQPTLAIVMPALEELSVAGAARAELAGFSGATLELNGAGAFSLVGRDSRYDALTLKLAGAGRVDFDDLVVIDAELELAGANRVSLHLNGGVLSGSVAGAGSVNWIGEVSEQRVTVAGPATVHQRR